MKIFLTGGCGDLGHVLAPQLPNVVRFDIRSSTDSNYYNGSILDRENLKKALAGVDCIVHIAAWHGYHEFVGAKNVYDFWDLNVTGTFNVFQAALENKINKIVLVSSESVADKNGIYGWTKVLSEQIAQRYVENFNFNVITLRPRAFIPYWNKEVYPSYIEWAKWFWKGAVHITDVAQAVIQSINLLAKQKLSQHLILPVDGAYEYTDEDLLNWDKDGPASTFKKYYADYYNTVVQYGIDPTVKPTKQDISETTKWLGYIPHYSLKNLLAELSQYGRSGPPLKHVIPSSSRESRPQSK